MTAMLSASEIPPYVGSFLRALAKVGYKGEWQADHASRILNATDNSIYQIMPQAVLYPRTDDDLKIILRLAQKEPYTAIKFMPRGGGTGTNGQSLNDCVIIDTSRHLNRILEINVEEGWVRVEPGVVPDRLNDALKSAGLFFPVEISPSKSATIGGMVSTDACGKGSRVYGKTADYILSMNCLLPDGHEIDTAKHEDPVLLDIIRHEYHHALANTPHLPRGLSGYNIPQAYDASDDRLNLNRLVSGSEGSLVLTRDVTLRVMPRPAHKAMFTLAYDDFDKALRHVETLLGFDPVAIETIDDHILSLARGDVLWHTLHGVMPDLPEDTKAMHFVEFEAFTKEQLAESTERFKVFLKSDSTALRYYTTDTNEQRTAIIGVRKKCVGLLGNMDGNRRPIPFIEDTAVPPAHLADYIADLRSLLKSHGLVCGMFGHSDAGCLHVRPALDLRLIEDEKFIRLVTDGVVALLKKHGGVLWGEHGKGLRGSYTEELIGTPYYGLMQKIKNHFDPMGRLNPGKIASSEDLIEIDAAPLRGQYDRQIDPQLAAQFPKATQCNGNGLCFSAMPDDTMCPSYKVTGDRKHSPKGRATLLREWMRLETVEPQTAKVFAHDVYDALHGCLSCKACTSTCPIHVNIPQMKSDFLQRYHRDNKRPLRDYVVALSETLLPWQKFMPDALATLIGLRDLPGAPKKSGLKDQPQVTPASIAAVVNPVLIVQDSYTSHYEPDLVMAIFSLVRKLGHTPLLVPLFDSGKAWHVKGFVRKFQSVAQRNAKMLEALAQYNVPMVGIDPSLTLIHRDEYKMALSRKPDYTILLLQEWLSNIPVPVIQPVKTSHSLFMHCTEKTMLPQSAGQWRDIFARFNIDLKIMETGCCGMAGAYGHEAEHVDLSKKLYDLSWKDKIDDSALITGFSCRSQIKRCDGRKARHPVELLNDLL